MNPLGKNFFIICLVLLPFALAHAQVDGAGGVNSQTVVTTDSQVGIQTDTQTGVQDETPLPDSRGPRRLTTTSARGTAAETDNLVTAPTAVDFLNRVRGVLDAVIPFIIGLAVFVLLWGIFTYLTHAAEEEKRAEAKRFIVWGMVGVFFMLSIWGFVNILVNTFAVQKQIEEGDIPKVPKLCPPDQATC